MKYTKRTRKQIFQELSKKAEQEALLKKVAQEADEQSADSADFSEKLFNKLLDSIKIEGLEED